MTDSCCETKFSFDCLPRLTLQLPRVIVVDITVVVLSRAAAEVATRSLNSGSLYTPRKCRREIHRRPIPEIALNCAFCYGSV